MKLKVTYSSHCVCEGETADELRRAGFVFKAIPNSTYIEQDGELYKEFETLQDLMFFVIEFGPVVLTADEIEIYNDYRET